MALNSGIEIAESKNVELVAYHPTEKRPPFKFGMQVHEGRWYLYCTHLWHCGWTIFDVTDPYQPQFLRWIDGPPNTWTIQIQVAEGKMITGLEKIAGGHDARALAWGHDPSKGWEEGIMIWDVANPVEPRFLGQYRTGGVGTHRNFYDGGRYVHLSANLPGFKGHCYVIVDIADPSKPKEVSRWWWPGQNVAAGEGGATSASLHGPPYVVGDRVWLSYGREGGVLLDISDISKPRLVSRFAIGDFGSVLGVHTYLPISERNLAVCSTEAIFEEGRDSANFITLLDVADEAKPRALSFFPVPAPSEGAPYKSYYTRGGKFGPHNVHMPHHHPCYAKLGNLLHVAYFNAGLRIYDIRDPHYPVEVGCFVPVDPPERLGSPELPKKLVTQYEEVVVDARGFIYVSDKNYGLTILRYTGPDLD